MKRLTFSAALLFTALLLSACDPGPRRERSARAHSRTYTLPEEDEDYDRRVPADADADAHDGDSGDRQPPPNIEDSVDCQPPRVGT